MGYQTEFRNENRGYMGLIVWQKARLHEFDLLHYEVENRLLRLIEMLEQKRDDGDWITRIAEDPEEYASDPSLLHSITPLLHAADA